MTLFFSRVIFAGFLGVTVLLSGCASSPFGSQTDDVDGKIIIAPLMPDYKKEIALAKLNEILASSEINEQQRARFLYERGVIYDSVGLRLLARIDFHQALKLQPNLADAFNFIGIYYTQEGEFENAYESFDGVLELAPEYDYAYLNRAIALYYGKRYDLAKQDIEKFYSLQPADGYRALWLYLITSKIDPTAAREQLIKNRSELNNDMWGTQIVDFYLGRLSKKDLFEDAKKNLKSPKEYAERLCEVYFYLAKLSMRQKHYDEAANYFRLALATNIYDFVEHRYARQELLKLRDIQIKQESKQESKAL